MSQLKLNSAVNVNLPTADEATKGLGLTRELLLPGITRHSLLRRVLLDVFLLNTLTLAGCSNAGEYLWNKWNERSTRASSRDDSTQRAAVAASSERPKHEVSATEFAAKDEQRTLKGETRVATDAGQSRTR